MSVIVTCAVLLLVMTGCGSGDGLSDTARDAVRACGTGNVAEVDSDYHKFRCHDERRLGLAR